MSPERWKRACDLFDAATERQPSEADEFLRVECGGDEELLSTIRRMLAEHERTGTLDHPWAAAPAKAELPPVFSAGQTIAGRYRIVRYLSRGGMGEVYEAEHALLPDHVAIKTLLPDIASDQAMIERFKQEIRLARKIAHPNVCKVFDLEWHEPKDGAARILFLTMELLSGQTLSAHIGHRGRMTAADALPPLQQMAGALEAAHRAGVIHRDFKSSNVILVPSGNEFRAVVTDFGLARGVRTPEQSTATLTQHIAGTLDFMAPELLSGSMANARSDIYALGTVAYHMVTGVLPFAGEAPLAGAFLRARSDVPSPRKLVPTLPAHWEQAILRALDRNPQRRFSSAPEFAGALAGEAGSVTVRLPVLTRRRVFAGGLGVALAAAAGLGWRAWRHKQALPSPEADRLYRLGVDDIHAGAYYAATKALQQAVQQAPLFTPARARLAEAWLELDLNEVAEREFLYVRRQDNSALSNPDRLQIDAIDLTLTREFDAAAGKYERMKAESRGSLPDIDVDLGRAYDKASRTDKSIEAYRRAAEGPSHSPAAWLRLGIAYSRANKLSESNAAFDQAERGYQQASNLEGLTELTLQRGLAANRIQKYDQAAALLGSAMQRARDVGNVHQEIRTKLALANTTYRAGNTDLAESLARQALAEAQNNHMEPLTIRGFLQLGTTRYLKGDFAGAEQSYQQALSLARTGSATQLEATTHLSLANLYDSQQRSDDEIREAKAALQYFQPNHWVQETFSCLLAITRGELYRENLARAMESAQQLLDAANKSKAPVQLYQANEMLGNVLSEEEDYPKALGYYRQMLAASPDLRSMGYAALDTATTLARLGIYEQAQPQLEKAQSVAAQIPELKPLVARTRAEIALSQNRWQEAIHEATAALSMPNLRPLTAIDLSQFLGLALVHSGDRKRGLQKCEAALADAHKANDPGALLYTRLDVLEARLAIGDSPGAIAILHELEPGVQARTVSRWWAYALMAQSDRNYSEKAKQAMDELKSNWGDDAFQQYLKRPDVSALTRHLFSTNSAK